MKRVTTRQSRVNTRIRHDEFERDFSRLRDLQIDNNGLPIIDKKLFDTRKPSLGEQFYNQMQRNTRLSSGFYTSGDSD